jgi:HSP20 family protein
LATVPSLGWLRNEIDRLFEAPLAELARTSQLFSGWQPALDMSEDNDNLYVRVELPGMKKEEINVSVHDGSLSISGERKHDEKHENADIYRSERFFGCFQRTVSLPSAVVAGKVKAQYKDGVLTITLPKTEESKPKRVDVSMG